MADADTADSDSPQPTLPRDIVLATDRPGSNPPEVDLLGQGHAADTLDLALRSIVPPACIAVYGSWGSGKTTLLRRVQSAWSHGPTVWFDPWEYERREDLLSPLINAILRRVRDEKGDPDRIDRMKRLALGIARTAVSLTGRLALAAALPGAGDVLAVGALTSLKPEEFASHFETWQEYHDDIQETKARFAELVELLLIGEDEGSRLVVFLDDLDRCLPDSVVSLIEAVKLLLCGADNGRVVFVFALDRQVVGEAIRHRYPGSSNYTGESYLEKIFDLSLEVPPAHVEQMLRFIEHDLANAPMQRMRINDALTGGGKEGIHLLAGVLCEPVFANPRVVKRTLNRLTLLLAHEECQRSVKAISGIDDQRRFLFWLAGTERFRAFRSFFHTAVLEDTRELDRARHGSTSVREGVRRITESPSFSAYYRLLKLGADKLPAQQKRSSEGSPSTLRDFDDILRMAGL